MRLMRTKTGRALLWALVACALAATGPGCATGGAGHGVKEHAANVVLPPAKEEQLGDEMAREVEKEAKILEDANVQNYIDGLARKVLAQAEGRHRAIEYNFTVIDDPNTINAFALPGGEIYIYSGLLLAADDEAEVASVLAHEIAHVTERHIAERLTAIYGVSLLSQLALGKNPGKLAQIVTDLLAQGYLLKYGREQEREADTVGSKTMIRAKYDPMAMIDFFRKLEAQGGAQPPTILSSHPHPAERIERLRKQLRRYRSLPDRRNADEFRPVRARLK